jgi:serine protease inhibitor
MVVDFAGQTEASRMTINDWVEKQTEDRVKELLKLGALNPTTTGPHQRRLLAIQPLGDHRTYLNMPKRQHQQ